MASAWLPYALWPALAAGSALMQGLVLPAIKRTPPGPEAQRQHIGLHWVGLLVYGLPWLFAPTWPLLADAALSRALLFDPVLQATQGLPLFGVGYTALTDKLLRKVAPRRPDRLRFVLWLLTLAASLVALLLLTR